MSISNIIQSNCLALPNHLTASQILAISDPDNGYAAIASDTGQLYVYQGSSWVNYQTGPTPEPYPFMTLGFQGFLSGNESLAITNVYTPGSHVGIDILWQTGTACVLQTSGSSGGQIYFNTAGRYMLNYTFLVSGFGQSLTGFIGVFTIQVSIDGQNVYPGIYLDTTTGNNAQPAFMPDSQTFKVCQQLRISAGSNVNVSMYQINANANDLTIIGGNPATNYADYGTMFECYWIGEF